MVDKNQLLYFQKSRNTTQNIISLNSVLEKNSKTTEKSPSSCIVVSYTNRMQTLTSCRNLARESTVSVHIFLFLCGFSELFSHFFPLYKSDFSHFINQTEPNGAQLWHSG